MLCFSLSAGSCGSDVGWLFYKNHCYLILDGAGNQAKTWRESRRYCQSQGGDLLSITSVLEQFFIQHQVCCRSQVKIKYIPLSMHDQNSDSNY